MLVNVIIRRIAQSSKKRIGQKNISNKKPHHRYAGYAEKYTIAKIVHTEFTCVMCVERKEMRDDKRVI
ncbi:unnamed protein product [Hymenolepis diminuta]|uniref:Uncharacterized protein n=1 Tax=Hymenolepis diminuta TaxID=6216 RepID=A0A564ZEA9_HYMDI|nr:unnamed protein product [Hymenolepis diminuta]